MFLSLVDDFLASPFALVFCYFEEKDNLLKRRSFYLIELNGFCAKDLDNCLILDCTKSVTMLDIVVVVDNDISVHCSFSESGPIVGNFHRALVSRLSSGHRCFLVIFPTFA